MKPRKDIILVDGKKVVLPDSKSTFWVVVNKPRSVLTTMVDEKDRDTLLSIVPKVNTICYTHSSWLLLINFDLAILTGKRASIIARWSVRQGHNWSHDIDE